MPLIPNELDVFQSLVPLANVRLIEADCGAAQLAREPVGRHLGAAVVGTVVDERQLAEVARVLYKTH